MKKIFFGLTTQLLFLLMFSYANGQTSTYVEYTYDEAGNRRTRNVVSMKQYSDSTLQNSNDTLVQQDSISQQSLNAGNNNILFTEHVGEITVSVFPNPTSGRLTLKVNGIEELKDSKIYIYNEQSVMLEQTEFNNTEKVIDLSRFAVGNYFLKILFENTEKTFKIIKTY